MNHILLLEDIPEIRAWLKTLALQVFPGAQISEASRIHDALELVNAVRFDVAKKRIFCSTEREERHGCWNSDIKT